VNYANVLFILRTNRLLEIEMPSAYVLFNTSPGLEGHVLEEARKTGGIEEAYISYGVYDLIVKATADSPAELRELVIYKLRKIANVKSTLTLMLNDGR